MQPTIRQIIHHDYSFSQKIKFLYRFFKWQLTDKIFNKHLIFRFTPLSKLMLIGGFNALSGNYYFGISEPDVMPFVLHLLQPGDLFIDIGANGGAYTILASGERRAKTICIEAAPKTFAGLNKNIAINEVESLVEAWNVAVSDVEGVLPFTTDDHATNRVSYENRPDIINVPARKLDNILNGRIPLLIKLDIEGHEHNALLGATDTISSPDCKAIVIECSNTGVYYGYGNIATHELLINHGFRSFKYNYQEKEIIAYDPLSRFFEFNMIYIKDELFVKRRLALAKHIMMSGQLI